jgi:sec-independent protein translocase protein TatC
MTDPHAQSPEKPSGGEDMPRMSLPEHLDELRNRLLRATAAVVAGMLLSFLYWKELMTFVMKPFLDAGRRVGLEDPQLLSLAPAAGFVAVLKLCFLCGIVLVSPVVLWQMWGFVSAGLYKHEKSAVRVFFPVSIGLFFLGAVAAYLLLIPFGLRFLMSWNVELGVASNFSVSEYISSCLTAIFGMGLVFELPLVMLFLQATDIVQRETFAKNWRWAVLLAFVVGMLLTDPSPVTQILMAMPVVGLYFLGVWSGRFVGEDAETFRLWKAWPLVIASVAFAAMLLYADQLNDWAAEIFGGDTSALTAPGEPGGSSDGDDK